MHEFQCIHYHYLGLYLSPYPSRTTIGSVSCPVLFRKTVALILVIRERGLLIRMPVFMFLDLQKKCQKYIRDFRKKIYLVLGG